MHFSRFYSDVNGPGLPQWNEYDIIKGHYINLDINITTGQHLYENRIKFWLNDVPQSYLQYKTQYDTCFPDGSSKLDTMQNTIYKTQYDPCQPDR
jgi:hypothetical protein